MSLPQPHGSTLRLLVLFLVLPSTATTAVEHLNWPSSDSLPGPTSPIGSMNIGLDTRPKPEPIKALENKETTPKWHWHMMHDQDRNDKYEAGLVSAIRTLKKIKSDVNVVDIGAGAGLLSLLAARAGASSVAAIEFSPERAEIARTVVDDNRYAQIINVIEMDALDIPQNDGSSVVDIIVHELFSNTLLCERPHNIIPVVRERLKASIVVPSAARSFAVLVDSKWISSLRRNVNVDVNNIHVDVEYYSGPDSSHISGFDFTNVKEQLSGSHQESGDVNSLIGSMALPLNDLIALSNPIALHGVDFMRGAADAVDIFQRQNASFDVVRTGTARGVLIYFEAQMAPGVVLSTSPFSNQGVTRSRILNWPHNMKSILHSRPPLNEKGEWSGKVHPGDDVGFMWGPSGTTDACGMEVQLMAHNGKGVSQTNRHASSSYSYKIQIQENADMLEFKFD